MTVEKVLIFPSPKGNVCENDVIEIENKLKSFGIESQRYSENGNGSFDAIIALGGDGTMLKAAKLAFEEKIPIMAINFGTLGYMSCLEKGEIDLLSALKSGFETESRMLIDVTVFRKEKEIAKGTALNEAVLARKVDGDIAEIELKSDGARVCDYRADGIIIATPTGSSAYCMSAGGPIIDTKLDAICVCPICPHVIGVRTMVFSPNSVLEAVNIGSEGNVLLLDGKPLCKLEEGDAVKVERSEKSLELIKLKKDAFYETLYRKMS